MIRNKKTQFCAIRDELILQHSVVLHYTYRTVHKDKGEQLKGRA